MDAFKIFKGGGKPISRKIKVARSNRDNEYYTKYNKIDHNWRPLVRFLKENGIIAQCIILVHVRKMELLKWAIKIYWTWQGVWLAILYCLVSSRWRY